MALLRVPRTLVGLVGAGVLALTGTAAAAGLAVASMTLQDADLPAAFSQHFSHAMPTSQVRALQGTVMPGYVGGWQREFDRVEGLKTAVVTSSVLRYASVAQAHAAFVRTWRQVSKHTGARPFNVGFAQESRGFAYPTAAFTAYAVTWRYRGVNAVILVVGLKSLGVTQDFAIRMALKQEQRMKSTL